MISSFRQESIVKLAQDVGIDIFLQKPINPSHLNDILSGIFLDNMAMETLTSVDKQTPQNHINMLAGSKILLVEDNSTNQEIILGLLESSGIEIDIANNGQEGVERFRENTYELILMDLQMPVMDGYEATKIIRESDKNIPIVALTANARKEDVEQTQAVGMNEHLNKPVDIEKLYETLLKYIVPKVKSQKKEVKLDTAEQEIPDFVNIDTDMGLKYLAGNKKLYLKILNDFYHKQKDLKLESLDDESLERVVHTIKGLSINMGAVELSKIAEELELTLNRALFSQFYHALSKVLDELKDIGTEKISTPKLILGKVKREELFNALLQASETKLTKKCYPVMEEISQYQLSKEDEALFNEIKRLMEKYKFKDMIVMLEREWK